MNRSHLCATLLAACSLAAGACSESTAVPGLENGFLQATVTGEPFNANVSVAASIVGGVLEIEGVQSASDGTHRIMMMVQSVQGAGTFTISSSDQNTGTYSETLSNDAGTRSWLASADKGGGSIVITGLTATRVTGTFTYAAVFESGGATGTRNVFNGSFGIDLGG
jgi:hypothetical protein